MNRPSTIRRLIRLSRNNNTYILRKNEGCAAIAAHPLGEHGDEISAC